MPYVAQNKKYKTHINDKDMMTPLCISYVFFFPEHTRARAHAGTHHFFCTKFIHDKKGRERRQGTSQTVTNQAVEHSIKQESIADFRDIKSVNSQQLFQTFYMHFGKTTPGIRVPFLLHQLIKGKLKTCIYKMARMQQTDL